jgi:hypothetical protein
MARRAGLILIEVDYTSSRGALVRTSLPFGSASSRWSTRQAAGVANALLAEQAAGGRAAAGGADGGLHSIEAVL